MSNGLVCKVKSLDGKRVLLEIDHQELQVEREQLPTSLKEGDEFKLFFVGKREVSVQEKTLAKGILEEILNGE